MPFPASCRIGAPGRDVEGAHVVALQVAAHKSQRRKGARNGRTDHLRDVELDCQRGGMQRSCSAESSEREIAWVVPALHGYDLQRLRHRIVDDIDHRSGGGAHIHAERIGEALAHRSIGGCMIDGEIAAEQRAAVEIAEQEIAVGDGRLVAAAAVADRARIGARALADRRAARRRRPPTRSSRLRRIPRQDRLPARGSDARFRSSSATCSSRRRPRIPGSSRIVRHGSGSPWRWCRPCRRREDRGARFGAPAGRQQRPPLPVPIPRQ